MRRLLILLGLVVFVAGGTAIAQLGGGFGGNSARHRLQDNGTEKRGVNVINFTTGMATTGPTGGVLGVGLVAGTTVPAAVGTGTVIRASAPSTWTESTFTIANTYTAGDLVYASGANALSGLADVAVGQVLTSGGVGAAPAWSASPSLTGVTAGSFSVTAGGTTVIDTLATGPQTVNFPDASGTVAVSASGNVALSAAGNISFTGTLPVANGGTNSAAALNSNRIMVSSGGAVVEAGALTNGQLLIGSTGAAPVGAALSEGTGIGVANAAGSITLSIDATDSIAWSGTEDFSSASLICATSAAPAQTTAGSMVYDTALNVLTIGNGAGRETLLNNDDSGQTLTLARVGASTYSTIQHMQDIFHSAGWTTGGAITDAGGGNVDVAAGTGFIRTAGTRTSTLAYFDWGASAGNAIPANTVRYIGVEYNAGTPQVVVSTTDDWDNLQEFALGTVVNQAGTLYISQNEHAVGDHAGMMIDRAYQTMTFERDNKSGGLILGESADANRYITMTAGAIWSRLNRFAVSAIDTDPGGGADSVTSFYTADSGATWTAAAITAWPFTNYNDITAGLTALTNNNRWANLWFYASINDALYMVYGQAEYPTAAQAEDEGAPSVVPPAVSNGALLVGRITFRKSTTPATSVASAFSVTFANTAATDHGNLAGLTDDDHTQYLLVDGTRAMTGGITLADNAAATASVSGAPWQLTSYETTVSETPIIFNINADYSSSTDYLLEIYDNTGAAAARRFGVLDTPSGYAILDGTNAGIGFGATEASIANAAGSGLAGIQALYFYGAEQTEASGATPTFSCAADGETINFTVTTNVTSYTFANGSPSQRCIILWRADGDGGETIAAPPANVRYATGPTSPTVASEIYKCIYDWDAADSDWLADCVAY